MYIIHVDLKFDYHPAKLSIDTFPLSLYWKLNNNRIELCILCKTCILCKIILPKQCLLFSSLNVHHYVWNESTHIHIHRYPLIITSFKTLYQTENTPTSTKIRVKKERAPAQTIEILPTRASGGNEDFFRRSSILDCKVGVTGSDRLPVQPTATDLLFT